jgi:hypothetical protein
MTLRMVKTRFIGDTDKAVRSELHQHLAGHSAEYWAIKIFRDGAEFPRVHVGKRSYIKSRWGEGFPA